MGKEPGGAMEIYIIGGGRSAFCEYVGTPGFGLFKDLSAIELGAIVTREVINKYRINVNDIDHIIIGNALQTSADALYCARHIGLRAGIPVTVPALTVNRLCGSGIQSVISAAQLIKLNEAKLVIAGGTENMSQAPHILRKSREGYRLGVSPVLEDSLYYALFDTYSNLYMAQTAEKVAKEYNISREQQDEYALRSHQLGARSVLNGLFNDEIIPIKVKFKGEEKIVYKDDHIKPDTTLESLSKLKPAFSKDGTVTAGNASGIVDGAAILMVASKEYCEVNGIKPLGKIIGWSYAGVEPSCMGLGPVYAIKKLLNQVSLKLDDIDLFEINEAFAGQYLACEKLLELDRNKVNINGGAISLGHPLGATGTRLILTLLLSLKRAKKKLGIASACIGGGQGIAILVEAL